MAGTEPPEQRAGILYVDTSALLKLLVREVESTAIERELVQWSNLATSVITEVELPRAVARARQERPEAVIDGSLILQGILAAAAVIPLGDDIVAAARNVTPIHVGALDAIHIASALSLDQELAGVATYDVRMANALSQIDIHVPAPSAQDPAFEPEDPGDPAATSSPRR